MIPEGLLLRLRFVSWSPNLCLKEMLIAITEAVISTVSGVGRILYLRPYSEYIGNSVTDGPNIQDIVRGSRAFCRTSAEISTKVDADFSEAEVRVCCVWIGSIGGVFNEMDRETEKERACLGGRGDTTFLSAS